MVNNNKNIAFLGAGNMGGAIISALLEREAVHPEQLRICNRSAEKLKPFAGQGIQVSQQPEEVIADADFVFLAVKPQDAGKLLAILNGSFLQNAVLVSIAAGLSVEFLQAKSGLQKIIRVLPNTPTLVHMGVAQMYAAPTVEPDERQYIQKLFESFGSVVMCENEEQVNTMGIISGCGPAFFFRILEIFAAKLQEFGCSEEEARAIALDTMRGSGELAKISGQSFQALREQVTSKGGITEAALKQFAEKGLDDVLNAGVEAAVKRTKELGS